MRWMFDCGVALLFAIGATTTMFYVVRGPQSSKPVESVKLVTSPTEAAKLAAPYSEVKPFCRTLCVEFYDGDAHCRFVDLNNIDFRWVTTISCIGNDNRLTRFSLKEIH